MTQQDYQVYVEDMDDRARREIALAWFMGWLEGYTDSGGVVDAESIEQAQARAEKKFDAKLLAFGSSESTREESSDD